jgi:hypothetical protein
MIKNILTGTFIVIAFIVFILLIFGAFGTTAPEASVIGSTETIRLLTEEGEVDVVAKIDTGADFSSIDETLARSLGYQPDNSERKIIITEQGREERAVVRLTFMLGNRRISSISTLADRSNFSTEMIIGKNDLTGFRVDTSRAFIAQPDTASTTPVLFLLLPGILTADIGIEKVIIIIPILGSVIVLLRLFAGVRTYGVFAPVVIALSLIDLDIIPGILTYMFLLATGIGAKILILNRLRLPHIAEFALIMFILVSILIGISILPISFRFSFSTVFFPLIITAHLIEQSSKTIEEHNLRDFLPIITATFATALLLALFGSVLLQQSMVTLWVTFLISILAATVAGNYLGLRFTEFIRFKFLKRNHAHK